MEKFKGTKGKWKVTSDRKKVTSIFDEKDENAFNNICNINLNIEEREENAKLIAAAPLLLSEHQMDLQHLKTWKNQLIHAGLRSSTMYQEYLDMIEAKEKAINKALK